MTLVTGAGASGAARFVLAGALCGLLAAVVMDLPMSKQADGFTPAYVAAAVLRRVAPESVSFAEAVVVHHVTGALAGVLYTLLYLAVAVVLPPLSAVGGVGLLPHLAATVGVSAFVYSFFAHLVLPRAGRRIYEERATAVRGQWLRSTLVFGVVLAGVAPTLTTLV
ncbi:hypothetical protein DVK02_05255 [Halobellus sp. Atlit-31R]|nr:hypothetical protein DVK02_05255 [Halobellus sp. Atlit-31R]